MDPPENIINRSSHVLSPDFSSQNNFSRIPIHKNYTPLQTLHPLSPQIRVIHNQNELPFPSPSDSIYSSPSIYNNSVNDAYLLPTTPTLYSSYNNLSSSNTPVHARSVGSKSHNGTPSRGDNLKNLKADKSHKGLRHFSMKVLQKVQHKGITTYNEVADELVREFGSKGSTNEQTYDHKNIRRRVYDALNVLMAMNIIHKEKKEIKWIGLPTNSVQEYQHLEAKRDELANSVSSKIKTMKDLIIQQVCLRNLVNSNLAKEKSSPDPNPFKLDLPFAILSTNNNATIDCAVTPSRDDFYFSFEAPFEVYDDFEILRRLGYSNGLEKGHCSEQEVQNSKDMVARSQHPYIDAISCCNGDEFENFVISNSTHLGGELTYDSIETQTQHFLRKLGENAFLKKSERLSFQVHNDNQISRHRTPPLEKANFSDNSYFYFNHESTGNDKSSV